MIPVDKEKFALYGFELMIPLGWRVELNPKTGRERGDVAFQSTKGNRIFVSWGPLAEAQKRFKTLEEHRDTNVQRIRKGPDVTEVKVSDLSELQIGGHRALGSHVTATVKAGMMSRRTAEREVWSVHVHCPKTGRYYVLYSMTRDPTEFEDFPQIFKSVSESFVCHPVQEDEPEIG